MIITPAALNSLNIGFSAAFQSGFEMAQPRAAQVAMMVPGTGSATTYGWLGQWPGFREWVGDRVLKDLKAHSYTLTNKPLESSVKVDRDQIEDDLTGTYGPMLQEMGRATAILPDELVFGAVNLGVSQLCYDGQFFFDTDHPVYANVDGTGAVTTVSNFEAGANPTWYVLDTSRAIKPFILQTRRAAQFVAMTKMDDERVFTAKEFRWGVDGRWAAGYGLWQLAHASKATLTRANVQAVITKMRQRKADGGRPMNVTPTVLLVPEAQREAAEEAVKVLVAGGETNILASQSLKVVTSAYLSDTP